MDPVAYSQLLGIVAALGGGLLVGIQRERRKDEHSPNEPAGVRTFTIVALIGAAATLLGTGMQWFAGLAVTAFAVAAYTNKLKREPSLTTEIALLATFLLGALSMTASELAAALFVVLAALLQMKHALHYFTKNMLSEQELDDALLLAASVLIVLPLLPDRAFDPFAVLNPRRIWLFAILVMSINASGYIALRAFGGRRGLLLAGFLSGFISSTATIAAMGQRARADPGVRKPCVAAALASNVATSIELTLVLLAAAPEMAGRFGPALLVSGCTAAAGALWFLWRGGASIDEHRPHGRPFHPGQALLFAGILAAATLLAAVLHDWLGRSGIVVAAAATGFADVHAAAISITQFSRNPADASLSSYALVAAFTANSIMKCLVAGAGGRSFAAPVIAGVAVVALTMFGTVWLTAGP